VTAGVVYGLEVVQVHEHERVIRAAVSLAVSINSQAPLELAAINSPVSESWLACQISAGPWPNLTHVVETHDHAVHLAVAPRIGA